MGKKICRYCDSPSRMEIKMVTGRLEEQFGVCYSPTCMIQLQRTVTERRQLERQWLHEDIASLVGFEAEYRTCEKCGLDERSINVWDTDKGRLCAECDGRPVGWELVND